MSRAIWAAMIRAPDRDQTGDGCGDPVDVDGGLARLEGVENRQAVRHGSAGRIDANFNRGGGLLPERGEHMLGVAGANLVVEGQGDRRGAMLDGASLTAPAPPLSVPRPAGGKTVDAIPAPRLVARRRGNRAALSAMRAASLRAGRARCAPTL